jgi:hypothetical protein
LNLFYKKELYEYRKFSKKRQKQIGDNNKRKHSSLFSFATRTYIMQQAGLLVEERILCAFKISIGDNKNSNK